MEKPTDLETKYHKLATEYSKVRSQATVLKKAVIEEQAKALDLKDIIKGNEQKIRKHVQEMESLTFRNEQLTKRISVLQDELFVNNHRKKTKSKTDEVHTNLNILDEELQKKIMENAELVSTLTDKELEISNSTEKMKWMEDQVSKLCHKLKEAELKNGEKKEKTKADIEHQKSKKSKPEPENDNAHLELINHWKQEAEKWQAQYEVNRLNSVSDQSLTQYYETKLENLLKSHQSAESEVHILWAENEAAYRRLEHLISQQDTMEGMLEKSNEELHTTNENYKLQLDAMTEHIASQNETITKLSDDIEIMKHKLSLRK